MLFYVLCYFVICYCMLCYYVLLFSLLVFVCIMRFVFVSVIFRLRCLIVFDFHRFVCYVCFVLC